VSWTKIGKNKIVYFSIIKKIKVMKEVKMKTILKQIKDGKVECITDLKLGYVSIRRFPSRKTEMVEVVK
jgi:hypothetical protein